ncbi:unnamed protein product [Diplocarpon coronariae]
MACPSHREILTITTGTRSLVSLSPRADATRERRAPVPVPLPPPLPLPLPVLLSPPAYRVHQNRRICSLCPTTSPACRRYKTETGPAKERLAGVVPGGYTCCPPPYFFLSSSSLGRWFGALWARVSITFNRPRPLKAEAASYFAHHIHDVLVGTFATTTGQYQPSGTTPNSTPSQPTQHSTSSRGSIRAQEQREPQLLSTLPSIDESAIQSNLFGPYRLNYFVKHE